MKKNSIRIWVEFLKIINQSLYRIGGTCDHIHILCTIPKTMAPADLVEEIKESSSKSLFRPLRGLKEGVVCYPGVARL
jgi:REP element-mobilizing transposase RayT